MVHAVVKSFVSYAKGLINPGWGAQNFPETFISKLSASLSIACDIKPGGVLNSVLYTEASKRPHTWSTLCWTHSLIISSLRLPLAAAHISWLSFRASSIETLNIEHSTCIGLYRGEMVGNLVASFVGHCCPVGWPALFHWASDGIGSQPILYCCPAKYVYGPVEISTCTVKYSTQRLEISLGNEATSKNCFHRPSEKMHHN